MRTRLLPAALAVLLLAGCAPITRIFIEFEAPATPVPVTPAPTLSPTQEPVTPAPTLDPTPAPTPEPTLEPITFDAITVEEVGPDYAVISWSVTPPAQGWIEYGTDTTYGSETGHELGLLGFHRQRVSGLEPETTYHFRVVAFIPATDGSEPMLAMAEVR